MEYRRLGRSGLSAPVLAFGTATFGGSTDFFAKWGQTDVVEASRLIDICLDAGINLFDTADAYSRGAAEEILGKTLGKRRPRTLVATKVGYRTSPGPNGIGASRQHLFSACEASLRRLGTDYIDLLQLHGYDENVAIDETLRALDDLVTAGKVRYVGASNFSGWHIMKMVSRADQIARVRPVSHQMQYSLLCRDAEYELVPVGADQGVGAIAWSSARGWQAEWQGPAPQRAPSRQSDSKIGRAGSG